MDNVGSGELEIYLRSYWDYYLALEGRLLQTERVLRTQRRRLFRRVPDAVSCGLR